MGLRTLPREAKAGRVHVLNGIASLFQSDDVSCILPQAVTVAATNFYHEVREILSPKLAVMHDNVFASHSNKINTSWSYETQLSISLAFSCDGSFVCTI